MSSEPSVASNPNSRKDWSREASGYQKHSQKFTGKFARSAVHDIVHKRMANSAPFPSEAIRCLDIASGTGVAALDTIDALRKHSASKSRPVDMTATDISSSMLRHLEAQLPSRVHSLYENVAVRTVVQDMTALDNIPDDSIDICTMVFGIMFPDNPSQALREVKRVLDPKGGVATVVSWTWNSIIQLFHEAALDQGRIDKLADFPLPYSDMGNEHGIRMAAVTAGFKSMQVSYIQEGGVPMPVEYLIHSVKSNPGLANLGDFDEDKLRAFMLNKSTGTNEDGPYVTCAGTAMALQLGL